MSKSKKKAFLTALIVSSILLVVAVFGTLLFDYYMEYIKFDSIGLIVGHIIGFLLMFIIVYKYESKEDASDESKENHNIY